MNAVILAAGEGTRLWPMTENRPKHMIPIAGRPIIQHLIETFKDNGVHKFTIVVGYLREVVERYFLDGSSLGVEIIYVNQPRPKGTADALAQLENHIQESRFLLLYGDIYISSTAAAEIINAYKNESLDAAVVVVKSKDQDQYGLVSIQNGYVTGIIEKPRRNSRTRNNFVNAGIYVFEKHIFNSVKATKRSSRGEFELTDSIDYLVRDGVKVKPILIEQRDWLDIGRPWDLFEANERALRTYQPTNNNNVESTSLLVGPVTLGSDVKILSGSRIEGPTYIGDSSVIGPNCYIRPYTSIGQDVKVGNGCEIKNCIIMNHSKIPHQSYLGDSIIGERCNFGAGTITGNLRLDKKNIRLKIRGEIVDSGRNKLGAMIGDDVSTGVNVNLMPGVRIGSGALIGPGITVSSDVTSNVKLLLKQTTVRKMNRQK